MNKRENEHWHRLGDAWDDLPAAGTRPSALEVAERKALSGRKMVCRLHRTEHTRLVWEPRQACAF